MVQIAAAIGTILQLLITLGQSEAPPVIVQAPEGPDITVVVPDDHPRAGATAPAHLIRDLTGPVCRHLAGAQHRHNRLSMP